MADISHALKRKKAGIDHLRPLDPHTLAALDAGYDI